MTGKLSIAAQRILMCRPTHFQVSYSINPWMRISRQVDVSKASDQWKSLKQAIEDAGATVDVIEPQGAENLPDLVFTANAAVVRGKKAFLATFANEERKDERSHFEEWFIGNGFDVAYGQRPHEGAGDALWAGPDNKILFAGVGPRSDARSLNALRDHLDSETDPIQVLPCRLVDPRFYHLDTCFCPLNENLALYYKGAFDPVSREKMGRHIEMIPVTTKEAENFACNSVVIGKTVIMHQGSSETEKILNAHGFSVVPVDMSEFMKSGGSAKCCTLKLD